MWYGDMLDYLTLPPTAKAPYDADQVLWELDNWYCQCAKPEPLRDLHEFSRPDSEYERPLNFLNIFESEQLTGKLQRVPIIDVFQHDII